MTAETKPLRPADGDATQWLAYLMTRKSAAVTFRFRMADALGEVTRAEKTLKTVSDGDIGTNGDIGGEGAGDALAELRAAATHLRNAWRIAIIHERDLAAEVDTAKKAMRDPATTATDTR